MIATDVKDLLAMTFTESVVAVGVISGAFLAASSTRVCIIIPSIPSTNWSLSANDPVVLNQGGLNFLSTDGQAHIVHIRDYGDWVQQALFAISGVGHSQPVIQVFSTAV